MNEMTQGTHHRNDAVTETSFRERMLEAVAAIRARLHTAWRSWREARGAHARKAALQQQLAALDPRLLDDIGLVPSQGGTELAGLAISAVIDIESRDQTWRRKVAGLIASEPVTNAVDSGEPTAPSTSLPDQPAMVSSKQARHVDPGCSDSCRDDARDAFAPFAPFARPAGDTESLSTYQVVARWKSGNSGRDSGVRCRARDGDVDMVLSL